MREGGGDEGASPLRGTEAPEVVNLAEALRLMKADTSNLLSDMLSGISMWGTTAVMAFVLAGVWLALSQVVLAYAHPYGSRPAVLETLYVGYVFSVASASLGAILLWRYRTMRKRYTRLFQIASELR